MSGCGIPPALCFLPSLINHVIWRRLQNHTSWGQYKFLVTQPLGNFDIFPLLFSEQELSFLIFKTYHPIYFYLLLKLAPLTFSCLICIFNFSFDFFYPLWLSLFFYLSCTSKNFSYIMIFFPFSDTKFTESCIHRIFMTICPSSLIIPFILAAIII